MPINGDMDWVESYWAWSPVSCVRSIVVISNKHAFIRSVKEKWLLWFQTSCISLTITTEKLAQVVNEILKYFTWNKKNTQKSSLELHTLQCINTCRGMHKRANKLK